MGTNRGVLVLRGFLQGRLRGSRRGADLGESQYGGITNPSVPVFHGLDQRRDGTGINRPDVAENISRFLAGLRIGILERLQPVVDGFAAEILLLRKIVS